MRTALILLILQLLIEAFGLRAVKSFNKGWIELYVLVFPESERDARRGELLSDLNDKEAAAKEEGYSPSAIAVQLLVDMISEFKTAAISAMSALLAFLPEKLERGSEAIRRFKAPALVIVFLSAFLMINSLGFVADNENQRNDMLMMDFCLIGVAVLFWKREQRWARIALVSLPIVAILGVIAYGSAIVVLYRGYEHPLFVQWMLEGGVTMLPVTATAILVSDTCRIRIFRENWWAVGLGIGISVGTSTALAFAVAQSPETILLIWLVVTGTAALFVGMGCAFAIGTDALCSGILRTTAFAMKVLADVMRRLR